MNESLAARISTRRASLYQSDLLELGIDLRATNHYVLFCSRARVGFDLPARTKTGLIVECAKDEYRERSAGDADFSATRLGLFIRYRP